MSWHYPSIEATCDRCGHSDSIEGDSIGSGHFMFPTPDEVGWGWSEEGDLCPSCVSGSSSPSPSPSEEET